MQRIYDGFSRLSGYVRYRFFPLAYQRSNAGRFVPFKRNAEGRSRAASPGRKTQRLADKTVCFGLCSDTSVLKPVRMNRRLGYEATRTWSAYGYYWVG